MDRIEKPWGWYEEVFSETPHYKCKRLYVEPEKQISLQYHNNRKEYWTVVQGSGTVTVSDNVREIAIGDFVFVPETIVHRLKGGELGITIIEVQLGEDCSEEDIVRLQDDYGRE